MIFSVSNDGIEWSLDFGPDSVTLTVKDLVHDLTKSSQEIRLPAWTLLLSQRQDFLKKHLARVANTPYQQQTMEMRDEVFSSVGAHDKETSGYHLSDLEDIGFHWGDPDLNMDAVFGPGIGTSFSPSTFNDFERDWLAEYQILIDDGQDK